MSSEPNGHTPMTLVDTVAGDDNGNETGPADPSIYIHGQFIGGDPDQTRVRDVSVTIPVRPGDTFSDYAVAIEAAVGEIGKLGYLPGYQAPHISMERQP